VFNEVDIGRFQANWAELDTEQASELQNLLADTILGQRPRAQVSTSGLSGSVDADYLETSFGVLDPSLFSHTSFHAYLEGLRVPEELTDWWESYQRIRTDADPRWEQIPVIVGEFATKQHQYLPWCEWDADEGYTHDRRTEDPTFRADWQRGYGTTAFARQVARTTLTLLSLPLESILYWGAFSPEHEGGLADPECWEATSSHSTHLFERVDDSGVLGGDALDEPTIYQRPSRGPGDLDRTRRASGKRVPVRHRTPRALRRSAGGPVGISCLRLLYEERAGDPGLDVWGRRSGHAR
jgi:hypothetical protein